MLGNLFPVLSFPICHRGSHRWTLPHRQVAKRAMGSVGSLGALRNTPYDLMSKCLALGSFSWPLAPGPVESVQGKTQIWGDRRKLGDEQEKALALPGGGQAQARKSWRHLSCSRPGTSTCHRREGLPGPPGRTGWPPAQGLGGSSPSPAPRLHRSQPPLSLSSSGEEQLHTQGTETHKGLAVTPNLCL